MPRGSGGSDERREELHRTTSGYQMNESFRIVEFPDDVVQELLDISDHVMVLHKPSKWAEFHSRKDIEERGADIRKAFTDRLRAGGYIAPRLVIG
jgi:hypothetical protein